jgi:hypothetical protein
MKNLFNTQYAQAKQMIEKINLEKNMRNIFEADIKSGFNVDVSESLLKHSISTYIESSKMFLVLIGKAEIIGTMVINSIEFRHSELNDLFTEYQNFLLENNLIEKEDTMTENEKMSYYHAQQMEKEYHHMMECNNY